MGLITVEGMHFYAHHGFYREEQVIGGQFVVDVYMQTDFQDAAENDEITKTINYEQVYKVVKNEMAKSSKLIEHITQNIIEAIGIEFEDLKHLKVRVSKLNPPLKGTVDRVYVELCHPPND